MSSKEKKSHTIKIDNETWDLVKLLSKTYNKNTSKTIEDLISNNADGIEEKIKEYHNNKYQITKHLRFELSMKDYSDFWLVASILGESKKKPTLLKMVKTIKEQHGFTK